MPEGTVEEPPAKVHTPIRTETGTRRDRIFEDVGGVVTLLGAALVALSLLSFSEDGTNLIGPVGDFFADSVLFLFGLAAFVFAALLAVWGVAMLRGRRLFTRFREVFGYLLLLACTPTVLHLVLGAHVLGHPPGGVLGTVTGELLVTAVGGVGAALCCIAATAVAFILVTERTFTDTIHWATDRITAFLRGMAERKPALAGGPDMEFELGGGADEGEGTKKTKSRKSSKKAKTETAAQDGAADDASAEDDAATASGEAATAGDDEPMDDAAARVGFFARLVARFRKAPAEATNETGDEFALPDARRAVVGEAEPAWVLELGGDGEAASASEDADEDADDGIAIRRPERSKPDAPAAPAVPSDRAPIEEAYTLEDEPPEEAPVREPAVREPARTVTNAAATSENDAVSTAPVDDGQSIGPVIVESSAQRQRKRAEDLDRAQQVALPLDGSRDAWQLPPLSFLNYDEHQATDIDKEKLRDLAARLERVLGQFKVPGRVSGICPGPVVTLFEFEPEPGIKLSRISGLSDDIAMALRARNVRIIAPIPGKGCVGVEVPNDSRETVYVKEILADEGFTKSKSKLTMALGKDIEGFPVVMDLAKSPHLLIAGTTGSGKSVSVNTMITSLLYNASPDEVKLILIDPKQLEFGIYEGTPHLLLPVVTDPAKAATALNWAVQEMERRYKLMAELKVRNLKGYNDKLKRLHEEMPPIDLGSEDYVPSPTEALLTRTDADGRIAHRQMFHLVVVVDEFADLIMVAGKEVEHAVARLAQKARAAGIHVILATQRPSVDVITGLIKANFPTRISFRLLSGTDSRTVLDTIGAENLLGMGDMLYRPPGSSELKRVHGALIQDQEIEQIVSFLNRQREPEYDESILVPPEAEAGDSDEPVDELYDHAVAAVIEAGFASISMVQRKLRIGYNRSARIVDEMERQGVIGPSTGGSSRREVLVGGAHATI